MAFTVIKVAVLQTFRWGGFRFNQGEVGELRLLPNRANKLVVENRFACNVPSSFLIEIRPETKNPSKPKSHKKKLK